MLDATALGLVLGRSPALIGTALAAGTIAAQLAPGPEVQHWAHWILAPVAGLLLTGQSGRAILFLRKWFRDGWKFQIEFTPRHSDPDDPPPTT